MENYIVYTHKKVLKMVSNLLPNPVLATCELVGLKHPLYRLHLPIVKLDLRLVQPPHPRQAYISKLQNSFQFLPLPAINSQK